MKIILAHDSFTQLGGAEKVIGVLHEMFLDAPVYTLVIDHNLQDNYKGWKIKTSTLQLIYDLYPHFQKLLPLIPWAVDNLAVEPFTHPETADLSAEALLIRRSFSEGGAKVYKPANNSILLSSSSGFIKGLRKPKNSIHVNYCHTPTRFLWTDQDYVKQEVPFILRALARYFLRRMKKWDIIAAKRVDYFIANSKEVQKRIKECYGRDSEIIYPPIDTDFWQPTIPKSNYFLLAGRLQAHKKNDLIIEIFNELGLPLHVVGTGRQKEYLKSIAKPNITFYGRISDEDLRDQYGGAKAYIFPQVEDFGLMPLEAAACGTATIGIAEGGSLETILPGVTGELFENYDKEKIKQIILNWNQEKFKIDQLRAHAEQFSKEKFEHKILDLIGKIENEDCNRP